MCPRPSPSPRRYKRSLSRRWGRVGQHLAEGAMSLGAQPAGTPVLAFIARLPRDVAGLSEAASHKYTAPQRTIRVYY